MKKKKGECRGIGQGISTEGRDFQKLKASAVSSCIVLQLESLEFGKNSLISFSSYTTHSFMINVTDIFLSKSNLRCPNMTALYELIREVYIFCPKWSKFWKCNL
jgi:hypothetical protein